MSGLVTVFALVGFGGIVAAPAANACTVNPTQNCESNFTPGTEQEVRDSAQCLVTGGAASIGGPKAGLAAYGACQVNNIID